MWFDQNQWNHLPKGVNVNNPRWNEMELGANKRPNPSATKWLNVREYKSSGSTPHGAGGQSFIITPNSIGGYSHLLPSGETQLKSGHSYFCPQKGGNSFILLFLHSLIL